MKKFRVILVLAFGIISLSAMIFSYLALTDIAHNEADLSLEWTVVKIVFIITILFHVLAIYTFFSILKNKKK